MFALAGSHARFTSCWLGIVLVAAALSWTDGAFARSEIIRVGQMADGSVVIALDGQIFYCDATLGGFNGQPVLSRSGTQIEIVSDIFPGECPPPPPGPLPPPTRFSLTVVAGLLPDGEYSVVWRYVGPFPVYNQEFRATFSVLGGQVPQPATVPALSPLALVVGILLMLLATVRRA